MFVIRDGYQERLEDRPCGSRERGERCELCELCALTVKSKKQRRQFASAWYYRSVVDSSLQRDGVHHGSCRSNGVRLEASKHKELRVSSAEKSAMRTKAVQ